METPNKSAAEKLKELKAEAATLPSRIEQSIVSGDLDKFKKLAALQLQMKHDIDLSTIEANKEKVEALENKIVEFKNLREKSGKEFEKLESVYVAAREAMNQKSGELQQYSYSVDPLSHTIATLNAESKEIMKKMQKRIADQF